MFTDKDRKTINHALQIALYAHQDNVYGFVPYIAHCLLIADRFEDVDAICLALVHDVVEDSPYSIDDVAGAVGDWIREPLIAITRNKDEEYFKYIVRVGNNKLASRVKMVDLEVNMKWSNMYGAPFHTTLEDRYRKAHRYLSGQVL